MSHVVKSYAVFERELGLVKENKQSLEGDLWSWRAICSIFFVVINILDSYVFCCSRRSLFLLFLSLFIINKFVVARRRGEVIRHLSHFQGVVVVVVAGFRFQARASPGRCQKVEMGFS